MEIKKIISIIIPVFIAIMFISGYVANANYSSQTTATTTVPQTAFGQGIANAVITGYGSPVYFTVACSNSLYNNATAANVTALLSNLQSNNSLSNVYSSGSNYQIAAGSMDTYGAYTYFKEKLNVVQFGCLNFTGPATLRLPSVVNFTVGSQRAQIPITPSYQNGSISLPLSYGINVQVRLKIAALLTANGTIYGPLGLTLLH